MSKSHYIIPIFVPHIGCPHDCVFCNQNTITGKKRNIQVEEVTRDTTMRTIESYLQTIDNSCNDKIIEVSFFGGTFTAIPIEKQMELLEVAYKYKCQGMINFIRLSTRPDYIDIKELELLKKYGVDIIELGVQSLDEDVLKSSGRGHNSNVVEIASKLIKQYNMTLGIQIMLGLPKDSFNKDINTAREVCRIKPDLCRIYPSLVIKDTPMETMFINGQYVPYTLEQAVEICTFVYSMFVSEGIKVIRVGLQPTEDINEGAEVVSGPFHPAFRELVESSLMNEMIFEELVNKEIKEIEIKINPRNISKLYSNKKYYFNKFKHMCSNSKITVIQENALNMDEVEIKYEKQCKIMSMKKFMKEKSCKGNKIFL